MFKKLTDLLQGRSTFFASAFMFMGTILHFLHRLDATYINFMSVLLTFIFAHSAKEDYFEAKGKQ